MKVDKIISGGQTGADRGGLEAGRTLGIRTGGTAPFNWYTENGPDPSLESFGLVAKGDYKSRTRKNIEDSDATVVFAYLPGSPGTVLTLSLCEKVSKPCHVYKDEESLKVWLKKVYNGLPTSLFGNKTFTLNVAGNRESKAPGIQELTTKTLVKTLNET